MTKASNIPAIEKTTSRSWDDWVTFLDSKGAKDLPHPDIADLVYEELRADLDNAGWWSQSVTVAYEQHIGRRLPGQNSSGDFDVAVSKTVDGTLDDALDYWIDRVKGIKEFNSIAIITSPDITKTDKWRHWRVKLENGTRLSVDTWQKSPDKAALAVTHMKLTNSEDVEHWRAFWKEFLTQPR